MEFIDLKAQYAKLKDQIDENIKNVLNNANYIMGEEVKTLEEKLAKYVGRKYCATCANGTDALTIAMKMFDLKAGDAVFVPTFTFYSTAEVVSLEGATPIFVDVDERTFNMNPEKLENTIKKVIQEGKLTPKLITAVDLFGQTANFNEILRIAEKYGLKVVEDAAQGFGGSIGKRKACSFGDISTTSFFPAKPLGCYGDGGAIFTDDEEIYKKILSVRVHGKGSYKYENIRVGLNSRLDTIQAAILLPKLAAFESYELEDRNKFAKMYTEKLDKIVKTPYVPDGYVSSWAQYTLILEDEEERNMLQERLKESGIPTMVYYPIPLHKQIVYKDYDFNIEDLKVSERLSKCVLSLPMHPYMNEKQIEEISEKICSIIKENRK